MPISTNGDGDIKNWAMDRKVTNLYGAYRYCACVVDRFYDAPSVATEVTEFPILKMNIKCPDRMSPLLACSGCP